MREKEARAAAGRAVARAGGAAQDDAGTAPRRPPPAPREPAPRPLTEDEIFARKSLEALNAEKPLTDAFFALDSAQIGDEARPVLQKDADWMKRWNSTKVMVEGHADSRGTAEYNLALGERRASAVRDYLVNLGVGGSHHHRQQGQGGAGLHRGERVLLAAESPRTLRDHGEITVQGRRLRFAVPGRLRSFAFLPTALNCKPVPCFLLSARLLTIASAASRGSEAPMIGRPTTR